MNKVELQNRTKRFHIDVIRLCNLLPQTTAAQETTRQIIRSAGSVGSNYRAACRGKSKADFINKIQIVIEEADESHYWLEIIDELNWLKGIPALPLLVSEADQLTRIFTQTNITAKSSAKR
jgi:four helix bundle protein